MRSSALQPLTNGYLITVDERDFDRAQWLSERERDTALEKHRREMAARGEGNEYCAECGDPIPAARREAVKAELCIDCETLREKQQRIRS